MRNSFIDELTKLAETDERIVLITADLGYSVLERFAEKFPDRYLNVGIQEQNAIGVAAGLAMNGKIVYVYSIIPFITMRCFEQIRVNCAYMNTRVRLVGVGAGLAYGPAGPTHHAIEDIAIMRALPGMTVLCPGDPEETRWAVRASLELDGPVYLRLGKGNDETVHSKPIQELQAGAPLEIREGKDIVIFATSTSVPTAGRVANLLNGIGVSTGFVSVPWIKPLNEEAIVKLVKSKKLVVSVEEHNIFCGLGSAIAEILSSVDNVPKLVRFGIQDRFVHEVGTVDHLRNTLGLDAESLCQKIQNYL